MTAAANSEGSPRALTGYRAVLLCRVAVEALLSLAWVAAPSALWSVIANLPASLEKPWLDPFRLVALGAAAGFLWVLSGVVAARRCAVNKPVAWLAVVGALVLALARAWVLGGWPSNAAGAWLVIADLGSVVALAVLLQRASPPEDRLGALTVVGGLRSGVEALTRAMRALRQPRWAIPVLALLVAGGTVGGVLWAHLFRVAPEPQFASDADHFKHAPLGNGRSRGLPLYLWEVLPEVFADRLPSPRGWESLGLLIEPGQSLPVGLAVRTNGFPMVSFNCAFCHTGSYRFAATGRREIVPGAPATRLDLNRLLAFMSEAAADPRFTATALLPRIEARHRLSWIERALYRHLIIPLTRESLRVVGREFAWTRLRPPAGPGRVDSINILKFNLLRLPDDGSIGATDYMSVWDQGSEVRFQHGWNGSGSVADANLLAAAFLLDFDPRVFNQASYERMVGYLATLQPPRFPGAVDASLAARGRQLFDAHCAECHDPRGAQTGRVTPNHELGVDDHYLHTWRPDLVAWLKALRREPFAFPGLRDSDGFVNVPLAGIWLRGPYLHNGSVPTVEDLLLPPEQRPARFRRGCDVVDLERLGFVTAGPVAERDGALQDNHLLGNDCGGHRYGTDLSVADRRAVIEYLKTL